MKTKNYNSVLMIITVLLMSNLNFGQWTQLTEIPTARTFSAGCELDSKIYVLGGVTSTNTNGSGTIIMNVYDPTLNSWDTTKADMPTGRVELGVCAVNGKVYAIGGAASHGASPLGIVEEYDPLTDTWDINKTPMPTPRKGIAVGVIDNKIYVAGGTAVSNFTASNKLEIYDPETNTWETKEPMLQSMYQPQGAVVNDTFYVIGGLLGFSPWTGQTTVQMYDPVTDTWSYRADLKEGRVGHTTNVVAGKIYTIGGDKQPPPIRTVEEYDPNSNSWAVIDSTPSVLVCYTASVVGEKIYVISGSTSPIHPNLNPTNAVWLYQPIEKNNTFQVGSFEFEGRTRTYEVYLPKNYHPNMPVVFALHGYTETVEWFKDYTRMHELGYTAGFITVYPSAIDRSWNSGLYAPGWPYIDTTVNDVGFISALIDTLEANYDIDMNRIYCCGYSLGGEMTYRLAIELGHRFAAVASVCGLINDVSGNLGDPVQPIPILHIHGTEDNYETWNGDNKNLWTVPETINYWLGKNDCSLQADTITLPDLNTTDGCTIEKISYTDCAGNSCFLFYKIINGGHSWPSSSFTWPGEGNKNKDINANEEIWNFFKNYENPLTDNSWNTTLLDQWDSDTIMTVEAHDNFVYAMSEGGTMHIIDVSEPTHPIQRGHLENTDCHYLSVCGNLVTLASDILYFIDVSNPAEPDKIGFFDTHGGVRDVAMTDHYAYVAHGSWGSLIGWGLQIIDISDPANPIEKSFFHTVREDGSYDKEAGSVDVDSNIAYVGTYDEGLRIIDVSDPENPTELSTWQGEVIRVIVNNNYAFVSGFTEEYIDYLKIIDVNDPANPTEIGNFDCKISSMFVTDNYIYLLWSDRLRIIDISNPSNPIEVGFYKFNDNVDTWGNSVAVKDNIIYVAGGSKGMYIIRNDLITTGVSSEIYGLLPEVFSLEQNYPNPFNPSTKIRYSVPKPSIVVIKVFDILGNEIETLVNEENPIGTYELTWNAQSLPSGVYLYQLRAGSFIETKKMLLIK